MALRRSANALWVAGIIAIAAIVLLPLMLSGGVPAFQHDWVWPSAASQCVPLAIAGFEPWHDSGLGIPAVYPESFIYHSLAGGSCIAFGPRAGLVVLLLAALVCCGFGYRALCRAVAAGERIAFSGAVSFAIAATAIANPIVLNKLQAGHLKFILAYAILPWIAVAALRTAVLGSVWVLGALLGIAAMDPQFLAFGPIVAIVWWWYGGARRPEVVLGAIAVAFAINLQQIVPAMWPSSPQSLGALSPVLFWQRSQSGYPADAVRLLGYIGGYASHSLPLWAKDAYWLLPGCAVLLPLARPRARYLILGLLAVAGILAMSAWNTPLAPVWSFVFSHVRSTALFRESYNTAALVFAAYAGGLAIGLHLLRRRSQWGAYATCAALLTLAVVTATHAAAGIPIYAPATDERDAQGLLAFAPGHFRFAAVPGTAPLTSGANPGGGGYSPWSLSFDRHATFFSPVPGYVELYTNALLTSDNKNARQWLTRDGIGFVQYLGGWRTAAVAQAEPSIRKAERGVFHDIFIPHTRALRLSQSSLIAVEPFDAIPGSLTSAYAGARDLRVFRDGARPVPLQTFFSDVSPATGWARTALTPVLPAWTYAMPAALFTVRSSAKIDVAAATIVAGDESGRLRAGGCTAGRRLDAHFRIFACGANPVFRGTPPIVVSQVLAGATPATELRRSGANGSAVITAYSPWNVTARVQAAPGSAIVLRQTYDDSWRSSIPGARHVLVDGYANAWITPSRLDGKVRFWYAPAQEFFAALAASFFALIVSGIGALSMLRRTQ